ncbi:MAG: NADH-quinone oxidoreductase subunit A [Candidatus Kapabacteria bacterium]|nr:NADH-quinone oxidoreductase subunit A [Candidatus Kapabacteria bacterium]
MLTEFGVILLFFIIGFLFVAVGLLAAAIIRPHKPNPIKNSIYECGEEIIGEPWIRFNVRFYVIGLVFLLFDVEVVFLLPWAVIFKELGWFAFIEMVIFVLILIIGLAYVWAKGDLDWEKPKPYIPKLEDLVSEKKRF